MKYTLEQPANEPITIWTGYEEWDWVRDTAESDAKIVVMWNASREPVYHIVNVLNIKFNVQDLMVASAGATYGETALWKHPNLKQVIVVTRDPLVLSAMKIMGDATKQGTGVYEQVPMMAMDTVEKALAYVREQRSKSSR